jgi:hypothetical protein
LILPLIIIIIKCTHFPHENYTRRFSSPLMEELIIRLTIYWHMEGLHQVLCVYEIVEVQTVTWITS